MLGPHSLQPRLSQHPCAAGSRHSPTAAWHGHSQPHNAWETMWPWLTQLAIPHSCRAALDPPPSHIHYRSAPLLHPPGCGSGGARHSKNLRTSRICTIHEVAWTALLPPAPTTPSPSPPASWWCSAPAVPQHCPSTAPALPADPAGFSVSLPESQAPAAERGAQG